MSTVLKYRPYLIVLVTAAILAVGALMIVEGASASPVIDPEPGPAPQIPAKFNYPPPSDYAQVPLPLSAKTGKAVKPTVSYSYPWFATDGTAGITRVPVKGKRRFTPRTGGPMGEPTLSLCPGRPWCQYDPPPEFAKAGHDKVGYLSNQDPGGGGPILCDYWMQGYQIWIANVYLTCRFGYGPGRYGAQYLNGYGWIFGCPGGTYCYAWRD